MKKVALFSEDYWKYLKLDVVLDSILNFFENLEILIKNLDLSVKRVNSNDYRHSYLDSLAFYPHIIPTFQSSFPSFSHLQRVDYS